MELDQSVMGNSHTGKAVKLAAKLLDGLSSGRKAKTTRVSGGDADKNNFDKSTNFFLFELF